MASFEEDMESLVELRVRHWRPAIVQCIQTHQLCTRLASKGIITDVEKNRICDLYRNKTCLDASNELLNLVISKKQAQKWALFLEALDDEGLEYVKSRLIASDIELPEEREHGKTMLQFFGPDLEKEINEPLQIARLLKNKKVITDVDLQEITNSTLQRSTNLAVHILLTRIQCHKRPAEWYYEFLCSLRDEGYQHLANKLEPDFLKNPSAYMPKLGPIQPSNNEKEHVLEDKMKFEPSNDLNAQAPSTSETFESKSESEVQEQILKRGTNSGNRNDSRTDIENLKDLNIKPVEEFTDKTNESDEESEEENTLASDYESSDAEEEEPKPHLLELRDYQIELAEEAIKGKNTIICSETGTGKTWVALHIVASHLAKASNSPKKVVFMARTGVLIKQQANRFKRHLPQYQTKLITGEEEESRMIDAFVPNYDIMCSTPQILVNNLDSKNIETLSKFSLLVFDECHHTKGDEPYARLARRPKEEVIKMVKREPDPGKDIMFNAMDDTESLLEGMTESVQTETVEKFTEGHYKVMVCTSVGTEGIDVPDCNIVVNYNYSGDEITKIQMKGRSRKQGATHVLVGSEKQVEQEMVNAYKANLMYKAMDEFKRLNPKHIQYKIAIYQKEEMQKHRYKMEYEKAKKSKMSEDDLEILCRRCNTKACLVSDIRKLGHDHLVLDKSFANRITTKPHKSPKKYDGIEKKSKMFCKKCPLDWGIVAERDGVDLWILKIQCFKFRNMRSADVSAYKKWIEVPYAFPEMNLEDIPKFFGTVDEVA
ncbi:IFIH1-like protein [Mya arenaria]|uniref:IFIH1-like protein n=1 Tax=Mya arenaria TaxID=6604 RepID=A0ABY7FF53_MYAAR|nr:IFIH1-like protein [Mya arenaria]